MEVIIGLGMVAVTCAIILVANAIDRNTKALERDTESRRKLFEQRKDVFEKFREGLRREPLSANARDYCDRLFKDFHIDKW